MRYFGRRYSRGNRRKITPQEKKRQLKIFLIAFVIFLITGILLLIILNRKEIKKFIKKNKSNY